MMKRVGLLAISICVTACASESASDAGLPTPPVTTQPLSPDTASVDVATTMELATTIVSVPPDGCGRAPRIELRGDGSAVVADLLYFQESSPTCRYNGDGAAMFDSSFRPDSVVLASDGRIDVVAGEPGEVTVDIRELQPNAGVGVLDLGGPPLVATDGTYSLALPGSGCFVITIGFDTDTRNGQFIALAASSAGVC